MAHSLAPMACSECRSRKLRCDRLKPQCHHCIRRNRRIPGHSVCEYEDVPRRRGPDRVPGARTRTTKRPPASSQPDPPIPRPPSVKPIQVVFRVSPRRVGKDPEDDDQSQQVVPLPAEPSYQYTRRSWWDDLLSFYSTDRAVAAKQISKDVQLMFTASDNLFTFMNLPAFIDKFHDPGSRERMQPSLVFSGLALAQLLQSSELAQGAAGRDRAYRLRDAAESGLNAAISVRWFDPGLAQAAWMLALFEASCHPEHTHERVVGSIRRLDAIIATFRLTCIDADDADASIFLPHSVPSIPRENAAMLLPPMMTFDAGDIETQIRLFQTDPATTAEGDDGPSDVRLSLASTTGTGMSTSTSTMSTMSTGSGYSGYSQYAPIQRSGIVEITPSTSSSSDIHAGSDGSGGSAQPQHASPGPGSGTLSTCFCTIALPRARHISPGTPSWDPHWTYGQVQQEEIRRMVWSAMKFGALHLGLDDEEEEGGYLSGLSFLQPSKFGLFFPGETILRSISTLVPSPTSPKESPWALFYRSMLLYHACASLIRGKNREKHDWGFMSQFARTALAEVDLLETTLKQHTCPVDPNYKWLSAQYHIFIRTILSREFAHYIPELEYGASSILSREKAESWMAMHMKVGDLFRHAATQKPFFIDWYFQMVVVCYSFWLRDRTFVSGLNVAKLYLEVTETVVRLWPCESQRYRCLIWRDKLVDAFIASGIEP